MTHSSSFLPLQEVYSSYPELDYLKAFSFLEIHTNYQLQPLRELTYTHIEISSAHYRYPGMASQKTFRRIGAGFCGSVWASDDSHAIEREDGGPGRSLLNDYNMHQKIMRTLLESQSAAIQPRISLPTCHQLVQSKDQEWRNKQISRFSKEIQIVCNTLVTDRIPPFPKEVREIIIDRYCPEPLRLSIKSSDPDQDCLIRPYLGHWKSYKTMFSQ